MNLSDLEHKIDSTQLATLSEPVERLVHLLDFLGYEALTEPMLEALHARSALPGIELERHTGRGQAIAPKPYLCDLRWRVVVRHAPQIDI